MTEVTTIKGYRTQDEEALRRVNAMKDREEHLLRRLDELRDDPGIDQRWLALGRTHMEQAFMAINRSIMRPARITFDEDAT